jgi:hypothetical protein
MLAKRATPLRTLFGRYPREFRPLCSDLRFADLLSRSGVDLTRWQTATVKTRKFSCAPCGGVQPGGYLRDDNQGKK